MSNLTDFIGGLGGSGGIYPYNTVYINNMVNKTYIDLNGKILNSFSLTEYVDSNNTITFNDIKNVFYIGNITDNYLIYYYYLNNTLGFLFFKTTDRINFTLEKTPTIATTFTKGDMSLFVSPDGTKALFANKYANGVKQSDNKYHSYVDFLGIDIATKSFGAIVSKSYTTSSDSNDTSYQGSILLMNTTEDLVKYNYSKNEVITQHTMGYSDNGYPLATADISNFTIGSDGTLTENKTSNTDINYKDQSGYATSSKTNRNVIYMSTQIWYVKLDTDLSLVSSNHNLPLLPYEMDKKSRIYNILGFDNANNKSNILSTANSNSFIHAENDNIIGKNSITTTYGEIYKTNIYGYWNFSNKLMYITHLEYNTDTSKFNLYKTPLYFVNDNSITTSNFFEGDNYKKFIAYIDLFNTGGDDVVIGMSTDGAYENKNIIYEISSNSTNFGDFLSEYNSATQKTASKFMYKITSNNLYTSPIYLFAKYTKQSTGSRTDFINLNSININTYKGI